MAARQDNSDQQEGTPATRMTPTNTYDQANLLHRTFRWLGMQKPIARLFSHILPPLDRTLFRATGSRHTVASLLAGLPMIELTTIGAKSGQPRTTPLLALQDGAGYVVIASNFGKPNYPAWYFNLRANPQVTVRHGQRTGVYTARITAGDERARYWQIANTIYPGYALYAERASNREIPVVVLEEVAGDR
jgi:deazaflavin-dependent oxidoreductase (nitroreductase family)